MKEVGKEIVYSINVDDIQKVSTEVFNRTLNQEEIASVENSLGEYIDWQSAIEAAIRARVAI